MSDELFEGTWTSGSSGAPLNYSNWNLNEPNGGTTENCALTSNGMWHDVPCDRTYNTMCEKVVQMEPKGDILLHVIRKDDLPHCSVDFVC